MRKRTIAVVTPGGDASGINACLRAIVRAGACRGHALLGIERGYDGLLDDDFRPLTSRSVGGIVNRPGTLLKSSRCSRIRSGAGLRRAAAVLRKRGVTDLVVIGGDGSIAAARRLAALSGVGVVAVPASIDNDVFGTDETIGFDTAADVAVEAIDKIRDTAASFDRVFVVEVMGREHGFLALAVGVASGAEFVVVPEVRLPVAEICAELKGFARKGKTSVIIVFAEGAGDARGFAGAVAKGSGLEVRVSSLGYIQRGGAPSARSRILAAQFGDHAMELVCRGARGRVVVVRHGAVGSLPISAVAGREKRLDLRLYRLLRRLSV